MCVNAAVTACGVGAAVVCGLRVGWVMMWQWLGCLCACGEPPGEGSEMQRGTGKVEQLWPGLCGASIPGSWTLPQLWRPAAESPQCTLLPIPPWPLGVALPSGLKPSPQAPSPLFFLLPRADTKIFLHFLWKNPGRSVYGCSRAAHICTQFSWDCWKLRNWNLLAFGAQGRTRCPPPHSILPHILQGQVLLL